MKNCTDCKYADWKKTAAGRLHPSGEGRCTYPWKLPQLPASMYWTGMSAPRPCGGFIYRKKDLPEHCVYFAKSNA